ncbi:hypothetical protein B0H13DRAFT_731426 [Mycena leptocephala]|nr:hypothetical protein B0H13DRAFT_731426 [Mycena leptocephala]
MPHRWFISGFRPLLRSGSYQKDFAANRLCSTDDQSGSVFIYRPLKGSHHVLPPPTVRPQPRTQMFTIAGCVLTMDLDADKEYCWEVTLGPPPSPNETARELDNTQTDFLQHIANVDIRGNPWAATWGERFHVYSAPVVVVRFSIRPPRQVPFECSIGDDIVVRAALIRIDTEVDGLLCMRYCFRAAFCGVLDSTDLRVHSATSE